MGDVEHIWWRLEFQDSVGNLPHIHALIWLRHGEPLDGTVADGGGGNNNTNNSRIALTYFIASATYIPG